MTASTEIELMIRDGDRTRVVPLVALAAVVRVPTRVLGDRLRALLVDAALEPAAVVGSATGSVGEGTTGEGERFVSIREVLVETNRFESRSIAQSSATGEGASAFTRRLAESLGDAHNIGAFAALVARHPREVLEDALQRTLSIPSSRIRKSRGAYFTGVVRILTASRRENVRPAT